MSSTRLIRSWHICRSVSGLRKPPAAKRCRRDRDGSWMPIAAPVLLTGAGSSLPHLYRSRPKATISCSCWSNTNGASGLPPCSATWLTGAMVPACSRSRGLEETRLSSVVRICRGVLWLGVGLVLAACGAAAPASPSQPPAPASARASGNAASPAPSGWSAMVDAAKKERQLVVQGPLGADVRDALTKRFQQAYPDIT